MSISGNPEYMDRFHAHLLRMDELKASDLFLRADTCPRYRMNGRVITTTYEPLSESELRSVVESIATPLALERFKQSGDLDFAYAMAGIARYRINIFLHSGRIGLVARLIPLGHVAFDQLGLPASILEMANANSGLILVVGPTGCGKSTTLASLVNHINSTRHAHIMTIEDPVEFVHEEINSLVHQRQVGYDTQSFSVALKHVVRQSPDVILIGELRDRDTVQTALSAALSGHLVLSTVHTTSVVQTVDRILNYFDAGDKAQARSDLATTLVGIVAMRLVERSGGKGRVPAVEILKGTSTARRMILEGACDELYDIMKRSDNLSMCTFNQSLVSLCNKKLIDQATAIRISPNPEELKLNLDGMFTGIDSIDLRSEPAMKEDAK